MRTVHQVVWVVLRDHTVGESDEDPEAGEVRASDDGIDDRRCEHRLGPDWAVFQDVECGCREDPPWWGGVFARATAADDRR